ncbi:hypothetical protein HOP50_16g76910 [Chloropicon primus]|uniref:Calponin-homology (CH) domain-containing protein n=1 Tax=Chloropicon primus TaxID=1764295 RepID=A0A5B8N078_9CHLO|nr:hypothetical protein A3770_16p76620 [Chloropicon primus]UPR04350.1 hypothetical protein HOP50_16g76910 [Chloropicon primus]|eukprot:QDZ25144.1 hypothetical protein A3770_16p76620 [Chloropicon primus]
MNEVSVEELQSLYQWVDTIPLSRPKRNIARDFSDGVLCAEIVHHYLPKLVDLHNYSSASGISQKIYNWDTLNTKCFKRIGMQTSRQDFEAISNCVGGAIEKLLQQLQVKIAKYHSKNQSSARATSSRQLGSRERHGSGANGHGQGRSNASSGSPRSGEPRRIEPARKNHSHVGFREEGRMRSGSSSPNVRELHSKERYIQELKEANEILDTKVRKLEQLVRLKDAKIQTLQAKLQAVGLESANRLYS